ncbi:arginyl-tRNA synthetase [Citrifermentans bemidjiense Bem]|uniref:Arginine--tRNA ligase n=1 Tax=Citrifermentans bemidjiense (strain ATCC BAA-1014 / DSM 16622 / JCM 12645 / Bem) TaxID=404380 RepID=SYR_CITBB|nr:arginine--tRNA ligase [Citrifermentans bemidjiense]B5EEF0.1 RecName: Full=Arginine--tRNA ligase; AltName: Full=Arginyl-tRNA synthetase; Short=ArgRS [Citrifermentans bemidjiense Bem]ACH39295.1 arginyl-tRNA synthetase [Citrifermentans bemidjiense Bem]
MKEQLRACILKGIEGCFADGTLTSGEVPAINVEKPAHAEHGDFATNVAMQMAKQQRKAPRAVAEILVAKLAGASDLIESLEIAGPGFINFFIKDSAWRRTLTEIDRAGDAWGKSGIGRGKKVQVEFVSANPTGPLHIGHGRGAATGDAVASLLSAAGFDVQREYYINDAGNQMNTLGLSGLLRYKELLGEKIDFPETCYQGDYMKDIARDAVTKYGDRFLKVSQEDGVAFFSKMGGDLILAGIDQDLQDFGIRFDHWFSEQSLFDEGKVKSAIEEMQAKGLIYEQEGALWFRTTDYGDDKDRVVVRSNGVTTYFASDIAYHRDKFARGFDWVIDVWGADHHGYVPRLKSVVQGLGRDASDLGIILVQLVSLLRDGVPVAMSTRSGEFVTLKEVVDEVGRDAARFFFLMRRSDSQLDFDLELAKRQSNDNPVYYVQYAHARIKSIFDTARERGVEPRFDSVKLELLQTPEDLSLVKKLSVYPEILEGGAVNFEPHRITYYLQELAGEFHSFYNKSRVITPEEPELTQARLFLLHCVAITLKNALTVLGISAPERM